MESINFDFDMDQFVDFDHASNLSMMGTDGSTNSSPPAPGAFKYVLQSCPTLTNNHGSIPPVIKDNFGVRENEYDQSTLDLSNFSKWIPRYSKPSSACDYCRSRRLDCWFTFENQAGCSACCALFRCCSFTYENPHPPVMMDTLHTVTEDQVQDMGQVTGLKALRCWDRTPLDFPDYEEDGEQCARKSSARFPKEAVQVLRKWIDTNKRNPYPTDEEKAELQVQTGLSASQVTNWLANTRRRNKAKRSSRGVSPSIRSPIYSSTSAPIPTGRSISDSKTWEAMNPLDRWKISPPENEPASVTDIANALATSKLRTAEASHRHGSRTVADSSDSGSISQVKAPSVVSFETGPSESQNSSGSFSSHSLASSQSLNSRNSAGSGNRKARRRRKVMTRINNSNSAVEKRLFQCTFCCDSFKTKYDWMRHEKSLHLNLEKWICCPIGGVLASPVTGDLQCVFCGAANPSEEHLETHNHSACKDKSIDERTFFRKDHLRQHLNLVHNCKMTEGMKNWKSEVVHIESRCGFCAAKFDNWADRCEHLSGHFRSGAKMTDWKGCRGLTPEVAKFITNAMPPYLIGKEVNSPLPFSATNPASTGFSTLSIPPQADISRQVAETQLSMWNQAIACAGDMVPLPDGLTDSSGWELFGMMDLAGTGVNANINVEKGHIPSPAPRVSTCWEILTVRLGLYVKEMKAAGFSITDDMLQRQARIILYESDDNWNQTAADDLQWLNLFKKAHGLPNKATDTYVDFVDDLGMHADLSFESMLQDSSWDLNVANVPAGHFDESVLTTAMDEMYLLK
jgi:hypothetical protein